MLWLLDLPIIWMVLFQNQRKGFNSYICHLDGYQHSNRFLFWLQSRMVQIDIKYCNKKWAGALASSGHGRRFMTDRSWVQMPHIITDILCGYLIDLIGDFWSTFIESKSVWILLKARWLKKFGQLSFSLQIDWMQDDQIHVLFIDQKKFPTRFPNIF